MTTGTECGDMPGTECGDMQGELERIAVILVRIERLAEELRADPDGHVRRSATELRAIFESRGAVEPAAARVRASVEMLRRNNRDESRREFQRRAQGLDHLDHVIEDELLPQLRRLGFDV